MLPIIENKSSNTDNQKEHTQNEFEKEEEREKERKMYMNMQKRGNIIEYGQIEIRKKKSRLFIFDGSIYVNLGEKIETRINIKSALNFTKLFQIN